MIAIELARQLRTIGLRWTPSPGDRFTLLAPELTGEVFTISEMVVEAHEFSSGTVLGFNGTTEWALDSVDVDDALWLPREDQLRGLLGATFRSLVVGESGHLVTTVSVSGLEETFTADSAPDAYAQALLSLVAQAMDDAIV